jgi:SAM-dependent methyltransferase
MTDRTPIFVGEDRKIQLGREAEALLRETCDADYVDDNCGIVRVPKERWAMAQRYERGTWMESAAHAFDDRNHEHATHFEEYSALRGRFFGRAIELGCGPFTNLRVIAGSCRIARCTLVDPLVPDYLHHRNCTYRHGILRTGMTSLDSLLGGNLGGRAIRRAIRTIYPRLLISGVPLEAALATSIEEMPECGQFDLVVMINVIEHCFDVREILDKVRRLCRRGSQFVFHDRLYNAATVKREAAAHFDAGHPLRVDEGVILGFLHSTFHPLLERRVDVRDAACGVELTGPGIYFIGEMK